MPSDDSTSNKSVSFTPLPVAALIAGALRARKQRIAVVEATTAGLISAQLVSQPGASSFFISNMVVYTGRGAKLLLSSSNVLASSGLFDREKNYKHRDAYVESKRVFCEQVARAIKVQAKADWVIVESGTSGPDFFVPGVRVAHTSAFFGLTLHARTHARVRSSAVEGRGRVHGCGHCKSARRRDGARAAHWLARPRGEHERFPRVCARRPARVRGEGGKVVNTARGHQPAMQVGNRYP